MKKLSHIQKRVSNTEPFINKYNWEKINYPSQIDNWKTFEKNNPTIAPNTFYTKENEIFPSDISKHNSTRKKQIILLKEGWYYLAAEKLSTLSRGITSKHMEIFIA